MNTDTYSVKVGRRYLGTNNLSPVARPMPAKFRARMGRGVAEVLAMEWGGTVVEG